MDQSWDPLAGKQRLESGGVQASWTAGGRRRPLPQAARPREWDRWMEAPAGFEPANEGFAVGYTWVRSPSDNCLELSPNACPSWRLRDASYCGSMKTETRSPGLD